MVVSTTYHLQALFENGRQFDYERDEVIIRAGDMPSGIYCVTAGVIKAYTLSKHGEPNILMLFSAGEVFPLAWAITGELRDITFAALDVASVLRIPAATFTSALEHDAGLANMAAHLLSKQVLTLTCELDNLQYRSAREKVVFRLLFLARTIGNRQASGVTISQHLSSDYLARSTNMTRETASREMSRLSRKQLIRQAGDHIVIPSIPRLSLEIDRRYNPETLSLE